MRPKSGTLVVAAQVANAIQAEAMGSPDAEICGLLTGTPERIAGLAPSPNLHPDPAAGFAICDAVFAGTQRLARDGGFVVAGCYHSHPSGDVAPSQSDILAAVEHGFIWIIASPSGRLAAWRAIARPPVKGFEPMQIEIA